MDGPDAVGLLHAKLRDSVLQILPPVVHLPGPSGRTMIFFCGWRTHRDGSVRMMFVIDIRYLLQVLIITSFLGILETQLSLYWDWWLLFTLFITHGSLLANEMQFQVQEVYDFIRTLPGCSMYADDFLQQEIDGSALMLLKEDHLMTTMNVKLGPALKICSKISSLKEWNHGRRRQHRIAFDCNLVTNVKTNSSLLWKLKFIVWHGVLD